MSKLVKSIKEHKTGNSKAVLGSIIKVDDSFTYIRDLNYTEYKVGVLISSSGCAKNSKELEALVAQTQRYIAEEVFGEFRMYFVEIQQLLWKRDFDKASEKLSEMEQLMYSNK